MKLREQKKKNGNIEAGSKRAVKRGVIDGFQVSVEKQLKSEEREWRSGLKWGVHRTRQKKKKQKKNQPLESGARKAVGKEQRAESRLWNVQIHLLPRDSLAFLSECLVINRIGSVCLTGGSLQFDKKTFISPENSQKMDRETNRRISHNKAQYFISQQLTWKVFPTQAIPSSPHRIVQQWVQHWNECK